MDKNSQNMADKRRFFKKDTLFWIIFGLVIAGAIWAWEDGVKDSVIPRRFGVVKEGLIYRSGILHRKLIEKTLKKHNIEVIVDLTNYNPEHPDQRAEKEIADRLGIEVYRFPLGGDGTGKREHYVKALKALIKAERSGKAVLVHCAAGSQRTGGIIACYRLLVEKRDVDFIVDELRKYDWKHDDIEIIDYLNAHLPYIADELKEAGLIESVPEPMPVFPQND